MVRMTYEDFVWLPLQALVLSRKLRMNEVTNNKQLKVVLIISLT